MKAESKEDTNSSITVKGDPPTNIGQTDASETANAATSPKAVVWFDKVFSRGFTPEDLILYLLSALLIFAFWSIFQDSQEREERLTKSISSDVAAVWGPDSDKATVGLAVNLDDDEWINMNHIGAQLTLSAMRYQQGSISTAAISTRKNLAFLAGTIMVIIGCVIIIRGVRQSQTRFNLEAFDKAKVTLLTTSPGAFVVLLGSIIIVATVLTSGERPEIKDDGIQCQRCGVVVLGSNETLRAISATPTVAGSQDSSASGNSGFPAIRTTPVLSQNTPTPTPSQ